MLPTAVTNLELPAERILRPAKSSDSNELYFIITVTMPTEPCSARTSLPVLAAVLPPVIVDSLQAPSAYTVYFINERMEHVGFNSIPPAFAPVRFFCLMPIGSVATARKTREFDFCRPPAIPDFRRSPDVGGAPRISSYRRTLIYRDDAGRSIIMPLAYERRSLALQRLSRNLGI